MINHQEKLKEVKKGTKKCFKGCETLSKVKKDNVCGAKIKEPSFTYLFRDKKA